MYFKPTVAFALLAVCSANLLASSSNKILVTSGGSQAIVANSLGQQAIIKSNPFSALTGPQTIQIVIAGPGMPPQAIQVPDQQVGLGGKKQSNVLRKILATFSGIHDEISYQQLLNVIAEEVQVGKVNPAVLQALQSVSKIAQSSQTGNPVTDQVVNSQKAAAATQIIYGQQTPFAGASLQSGYGLAGVESILGAQGLADISGSLQGSYASLIPASAQQGLGAASGIAGIQSIAGMSGNIQGLYGNGAGINGLSSGLGSGKSQALLAGFGNPSAQWASQNILNAHQAGNIQAQLQAGLPLGPQVIIA